MVAADVPYGPPAMVLHRWRPKHGPAPTSDTLNVGGFPFCVPAPTFDSCLCELASVKRQNLVHRRCLSTFARVGSFWSSRKTSAATSRTAMDSTPNEALPVRDVVVATRKVPMIEAVLGKK